MKKADSCDEGSRGLGDEIGARIFGPQGHFSAGSISFDADADSGIANCNAARRA